MDQAAIFPVGMVNFQQKLNPQQLTLMKTLTSLLLKLVQRKGQVFVYNLSYIVHVSFHTFINVGTIIQALRLLTTNNNVQKKQGKWYKVTPPYTLNDSLLSTSLLGGIQSGAKNKVSMGKQLMMSVTPQKWEKRAIP